ncbi:hypothetical protein ACFL49_02840 [Candidatus Omnitrophota bacterium]
MLIKTKRGQSIIEYSLLIMIVIAALLSVGNYFKRGVQGRWKASVDEMGDQYDPTPGKSSGTITHTIASDVNTNVWTVDLGEGRLQTLRVDTSDSTETTVGSITVQAP